MLIIAFAIEALGGVEVLKKKRSEVHVSKCEVCEDSKWFKGAPDCVGAVNQFWISK